MLKNLKQFYLIFVIVGTVLPWIFFLGFFKQEGLNLLLFIKEIFANGPAAGFSTDVLISILVFWVWSYKDAQERKITNWWLVLPTGFTVGLSLAMPLYFYLRTDK